VSATYLYKSSGNIKCTSLLSGTQVETELTLRPGPDVSTDRYTRQFTVGTATVVIFHTVSLIIIISTISTYTRSIRLAQQAKVSYRCGSIHYQHEAISGSRPPFILLKLALYIS